MPRRIGPLASSKETMMPKQMLTVEDVETMLKRLSGAIERDQTYVDGLPRGLFSHQYDDDLWRNWRRGHRTFIDDLLATVGAMSPTDLRQLTDVASGFAPTAVRKVALETFAEVVGECVDADKTARQFFARVAREVVRQGRGKRPAGDPREAISQWFSDIDPLTIAQDPECGYPLDVRASMSVTPHRSRP